MRSQRSTPVIIGVIAAVASAVVALAGCTGDPPKQGRPSSSGTTTASQGAACSVTDTGVVSSALSASDVWSGSTQGGHSNRTRVFNAGQCADAVVTTANCGVGFPWIAGHDVDSVLAKNGVTSIREVHLVNIVGGVGKTFDESILELAAADSPAVKLLDGNAVACGAASIAPSPQWTKFISRTGTFVAITVVGNKLVCVETADVSLQGSLDHTLEVALMRLAT